MPWDEHNKIEWGGDPTQKKPKGACCFPFMICCLKNIWFDSMKYVMSVVGCDYVLYIYKT